MTRTVAEKLQIKPGDPVFIAGAGAERISVLGALPDGAHIVDAPAGAPVAILFVADRADLDAQLAAHLPELREARARWILYPKCNRSDINRDSIWTIVEGLDWTLVSNVAVNDFWSAVRLKPVG